MASFTLQSLIDAAKVYVDDDHEDERGWIANDKWLRLAVTEYLQHYRRWVRAGSITPQIAQADFSDSELDTDGVRFLEIENVLAIVGAARDSGGSIRMLANVQPVIWRGTEAPTGDALAFWMTSEGDTVRIYPDPQPTSDLSEYVVKYVPLPDRSTLALSSTVELPSGTDERIVLGIARRAHVKDSGASVLIRELIAEADAEQNFLAAQKPGGLKVKVSPRTSSLLSTPRRVIWPDRGGWLYI